MREFIEHVFRASWLSDVTSPWLASAALHASLALYLAVVAAVLLRLATPLKSRKFGAVRFALVMLYIALFGFGAVLAVGLQSFVTYAHDGLHESTAYSAFTMLLFGATISGFGYLMWRRQFYEGWRT